MVDLVKELCEKEKTIAAERDRIEHSRVSSEDARSKCRSMAAAVVKLRKLAGAPGAASHSLKTLSMRTAKQQEEVSRLTITST